MTPKPCKMCAEKQHRINSILKSYKRDRKWGYIVIGVLVATHIFGKEAILGLVEKIF